MYREASCLGTLIVFSLGKRLPFHKRPTTPQRMQKCLSFTSAKHFAYSALEGKWVKVICSTAPTESTEVQRWRRKQRQRMREVLFNVLHRLVAHRDNLNIVYKVHKQGYVGIFFRLYAKSLEHIMLYVDLNIYFPHSLNCQLAWQEIFPGSAEVVSVGGPV